MKIDNIPNIDDSFYNVFMKISEALTGFSEIDLLSTGLSKFYYTYLLKQIEAASFIDFLRVSKSIIENSLSEDQLNNSIKISIMADQGLNQMANNIITLWYLGTWSGIYVNEVSYKNGLIWNITYAHPPGAKQQGFKSWAIKPVNHK